MKFPPRRSISKSDSNISTHVVYHSPDTRDLYISLEEHEHLLKVEKEKSARLMVALEKISEGDLPHSVCYATAKFVLDMVKEIK